MLLRDALKLAAKQKACGIHKDKHIGRRVVKAGNSLWKKANARIRAEYDSSAAAEVAKQKQQIKDDISKVVAGIALLVAEGDKIDQHEGSLRMSNCAFSALELQEFDQNWKSLGRASSEVAAYEETQSALINELPEWFKSKLDQFT